uniref:Uncharacterized protein n=1 Tax=Nelumbo nucifera TaxID=4432 RepID=A0A822ZS55_NELNU|nr:TPA_asm: hypothetical protein HUJ06_017256 [Nelumbo nucifera]
MNSKLERVCETTKPAVPYHFVPFVGKKS